MYGIQSKFVVGKSSNEVGHAWNQVQIDGTWYNTDLTWDADKIKEGRELEYCLQSDAEFIGHSTESTITEICNDSFDRNRINQHLKSATQQGANTSLIEYKPSIWSRMVEFIKNKLKNIQRKFAKRERNNVIEHEEQPEKLPSWDLRNWSPEELEFYKTTAREEASRVADSPIKKDDTLSKE